MDTRSFEGHMDWEYQDHGPFDPTSPFAQAASEAPRSIFASPVKSPRRYDNPFEKLSTPSKSQPLPPQVSRFTPQLPLRHTAPPFRNLAFTTPRRPVDEVVLSEASGAEDSPAPTETSDYPNDTPEADRWPSKIDKASRYRKPGHLNKNHASGKGEIRARRDLSVGLRKRRRHNQDRDAGLHRYAQDTEAWDSDYNSDYKNRVGSSRPRQREEDGQTKGAFESLFHALNKYPNTPDHMQRWMQLGANLFLVSVLTYVGWSVVSTVRSDIYKANELARLELMSKMTECQTQYTMNDCAKKDRPALRLMCEEWYDCMMQNPESIMRVKVTAKQVAEIINEFSEAMHLKAWGILLALILVCTTVNVGALRLTGYKPVIPVPPAQANDLAPEAARSPGMPGYMLVPVQTPRMQRRALLDDGTDTDTSPLNLKSAFPQSTPSGRRSPNKGAWEASAAKFSRGATKGG